MDKQTFSYADLKNSTCFEAVIRESLRVTPPVPLYGRTVKAEETSLMGLKIFKGTKVFFSCRPFHFDPTVWESPLSFKPERWDTTTLETHSYGSESFMPFGLGPRSCLGQEFALYMIRTVLYGTLREALPRFENHTQSFRFFFGCQIPTKLKGGFYKQS